MIICAGGFGNSGNTAVIDFFIDANVFSPFSKDFGESSVFRDKYGIYTAMAFAKAGKRKICPALLKSCLSGLVELADEKDKNIYIRNKRVVDTWGEGYSELLGRFMVVYERWYQELCEVDDLELAAIQFVKDLKSMLLGFGSPVLVNNDPPGFNPIILEMGFVDRLVVSVRDPVDSCHDWMRFYKKPKTKESVDDYTARYKRKVGLFMDQRNKLTDELKEKIIILSFEDFVLSQDYRFGVIESFGSDYISRYKEAKFSPRKSQRNVGEGYRGLDKSTVKSLNEKIKEDYSSLLKLGFASSGV